MKKFFRNIKKNQRGFTLVELSIAIIIIGILTAVAVPSYNSWKKTAAKTACEVNKKVIQSALLQAELDGVNIDDITSVDQLSNYFEEVPDCPLNQDTNNAYIIEKDNGNYIVTCKYHDHETSNNSD